MLGCSTVGEVPSPNTCTNASDGLTVKTTAVRFVLNSSGRHMQMGAIYCYQDVESRKHSEQCRPQVRKLRVFNRWTINDENLQRADKNNGMKTMHKRF